MAIKLAASDRVVYPHPPTRTTLLTESRVPMAVILDGSYKILSLVRGTPPLGVLPIIPAWQNIRVNGPVQQV